MRCGLPAVAREERAAHEHARQLLELLGCEPLRTCRSATLPFGTQKRVELGRALASAPPLMLLDEPASGLNHEEVDALAGLIRRSAIRLS